MALQSKLALAAFIAMSASCGRAPEAELGPHARTAVHHPAMGTQFDATLQTPLSTLSATKGDHFTLTVDSDVRGDHGALLLRAGATIRGRVVEVDDGKVGSFENERTPARMTILFEGVNVSVIDAGGYAEVGMAKPDAPHDTVLRPAMGPRAAIGGGPPDPSAPPRAQLMVPSGTKLRLIVTGPM